MTPDQVHRSELLRRRNVRRLQWPHLEQALQGLDLRPSRVPDGRSERLLGALKCSFSSERLVEEPNWADRVSHFARGRFGLTIMRYWDWDGDTPMCRIAAPSIERNARRLADAFPSGFALIDDDDRHTLIVDLNIDEDEQKLVGRIAEIELHHAEN